MGLWPRRMPCSDYGFGSIGKALKDCVHRKTLSIYNSISHLVAYNEQDLKASPMLKFSSDLYLNGKFRKNMYEIKQECWKSLKGPCHKVTYEVKRVSRTGTIKNFNSTPRGPVILIRNTFEKISVTFSPKQTFVEFVTFIANNFGFFFGVSFLFFHKNIYDAFNYLYEKAAEQNLCFWEKKPWSREKKILCQMGMLVGAPVGIPLIAGIAVPAIIIGIPVWVGQELHARFERQSVARKKRNALVTTGVIASVCVSPILAVVAVGIGVPILLAYVYSVVPISLCRSGGCGVDTSGPGVRIEMEEETVGFSVKTEAQGLQRIITMSPF